MTHSLEIIWEAENAANLNNDLTSQTPQVLLLDLSFTGQGFDPVAAVMDFRARFPHMAILILRLGHSLERT